MNRSLSSIIPVCSILVLAFACDSSDDGPGVVPFVPASGGAAGAGGAGGTDEPPAETGRSAIDDFEDGDLAILPLEDRAGEWGTYGDGSGTQTHEIAEGGHESSRALSTSGSGFSEWGAGVHAGLQDTGDGAVAYDASNRLGIEFWARSANDADTKARLHVPDRNSTDEGGVCSNCYDHFGAEFTATGTWQRFAFRWEELLQQGFGDAQPAIDQSALMAIEFLVMPGQEFELLLDDIAFFGGDDVIEPGGTAGAGGAGGAAGSSGASGAGGEGTSGSGAAGAAGRVGAAGSTGSGAAGVAGAG